jgi:hypothetical protein
MTNQKLWDKIEEILPEIKGDSKRKAFFTFIKDLLLPASVVILGIFTFRAGKIDSQNNLQVKYLELFYNEITDSSRAKQSNALDILSLMSPELSKKLANYVVTFNQDLAVNYDSTSEKRGNEELLKEIEDLKAQNARLKNVMAQYGLVRKDIAVKTNTFKTRKERFENIFIALNSIKLNDSKYETDENRLVTQNGKLLMSGGRVITTKVKTNKYNYSIADLSFQLNNQLDSLATNPILDFKVQFNIKTNSGNVQNKLTADSISIKLQTPSGYFTDKGSEFLKTMPAKLYEKNQFSFTSSLYSFIKGQYFVRFYINNFEIGEGTFNI